MDLRSLETKKCFIELNDLPSSKMLFDKTVYINS